MEHVLTIRLQFEDLGPDAQKDIDGAAQKVEDSLTEGYERAAVSGGEAMIRGMTTLQEAWNDFDWSHPINSLKKLFGGAIEWFRNKFGIVGGIILGAIGLIANAFRKLLGPQAELVKMFSSLNTRMHETGETGVGMGQAVQDALVGIADVSIQTGAAMEDVTSTFVQLGQARVPIKQLKDFTSMSILASKALGANVDQMADFIGKLVVMGRLNQQEVSGIIQTFSAVQDTVSLTEQEMSGLLETTSKLVMQLNAVGASAESIQAVAGATSQLTGLFGELGLGAEKGGALMEKLFDPTRLGENALLIQSMGMSMGDYMRMLEGGEVNQQALVGGLIDAASQIERMQASGASAIAMNMRAQQLGLDNYQTALRIAKEGPKIIADMQKATEGGVDWAQRAAEGQSDLNAAFGRFRNRFMAFFGKAVAPLIGKFTQVVAKLEEKWINNEAAIGKFFDKIATGLMNLIDNFDPEKFLGFINKIGDAFRWVTENLETLKKVAIGVGIAFAAWKIAPALIGGIQKLGGAIGGLGGAGGGGGGGGLANAQKGLSGFMKFMAKALVGIAAVLLLAAALWVLAKALKMFSEDISWEGILKGIVALLALTAVMVAIGAAMAAGGAMLMAGVLVLAATIMILAASLYLLAKALLTFGEASEGLEELSKIASPKLAERLSIVGEAINEFVKQFNLLQLIKAPALVALGHAIKQFAIGMWVLGEIQDIGSAREAMLDLADVIEQLGARNFKNNAKEIADTTKAMADSLEILSKIRQEDFNRLGPAMESVANGFTTWMNAVSPEGAGAVLEQLLTRWGAVSSAFKDMAISIWVLGETKGAFGDIAAGMDIMSQSLPKFFESMGAIGGLFDREGSGLGRFGEFMAMLSGLETGLNFGPMISSLEGLPAFITSLLPALRELGKGVTVVDSPILRGLNRVKELMQSISETGVSAGLDVSTGDLTASMEGDAGIAVTVRRAIEAQTEILVEKLEDIFDDDWKDAVTDTANVLNRVSTNRKIRVDT